MKNSGNHCFEVYIGGTQAEMQCNKQLRLVGGQKPKRNVVFLAQSYSQCQQAGKNFKTLIPQSKSVKMTATDNYNDELASGFTRPFISEPENKKYSIVAIDHKPNWPNATFVRKERKENPQQRKL